MGYSLGGLLVSKISVVGSISIEGRRASMIRTLTGGLVTLVIRTSLRQNDVRPSREVTRPAPVGNIR